MARIAILMAIYRPHIPWLVEQLHSLNAQTCQNLHLLVWNDDPEDQTDYGALCMQYVTVFPCTVFQSIRRLGSNGAFEELTRRVDADYIAYCDQDDIWLPDKLRILADEMRSRPVNLICSDMYVIDQDGRTKADSIAAIRPRQKLSENPDPFSRLLAHNFVTGCTILAKADFVKKALPFPDVYVHDWWLALRAAAEQSLRVYKKPLIRYRIHDGNQTGPLKGITDKRSYYEKRIRRQKERLEVLAPFCTDTPYAEQIRKFQRFMEYRASYFQRFSVGALAGLFRLRDCDPKAAYLEMAMPLIRSGAFLRLVHWIQAGNI